MQLPQSEIPPTTHTLGTKPKLRERAHTMSAICSSKSSFKRAANKTARSVAGVAVLQKHIHTPTQSTTHDREAQFQQTVSGPAAELKTIEDIGEEQASWSSACKQQVRQNGDTQRTRTRTTHTWTEAA